MLRKFIFNLQDMQKNAHLAIEKFTNELYEKIIFASF
jgi:hypothetical protein